MSKWLAVFCLLTEFCFLDAKAEWEIAPQVIQKEAERIGINLGTWTTWGAEQFSKNVLMNPGFEGYIDRVVVIVSQADTNSFTDDPDWGYDDDYWKGADFEVHSGAAKGTKGKIVRSLRKNPAGSPQYVTDKPLPPLAHRDVIILTKQGSEDPVPLWWIENNSKERVHIDTNERRPFSSGTQTLSLEPKADAPAEINHYLDAITERAGKLLPVNGKWRFSIWARSDTPENTLRVFFHRLNGTPAFFDKTIPLTKEWAEHTIDFQAHDMGDPQTLQLKIAAAGTRGKVWVDDVFLGPLQEADKTNFRQEVIDALLKIKPSYIRDTQGQLGDTFNNRIADIYARKATSSRAFAGVRSLSTTYSIPDLLQLCHRVGANPWIVIPPAFSDEEAFLLGQYLGQHADKKIFSTIIVEFGNENWNWVFRATGIPYPEQHGEIAQSVFQRIQEGAGSNVNLQKVVNGQYASPKAAIDFIKLTPSADTLAVAPYFFYTLDSGGTPKEHLQELFKDNTQPLEEIIAQLKPLKKTLAAYEINLHTTLGNASSRERDPYTAGQAAGSALAKHLLDGILLGVHPEIVFSLSQFDADTQGGHGKVKLWGITRDFAMTSRMRPQGLAVVMLNAVIGGSVHAVISKDTSIPLTGAAFKQGSQWKAAAVNGSDAPIDASFKFPAGIMPASLWVLTAKSPARYQ